MRMRSLLNRGVAGLLLLSARDLPAWHDAGHEAIVKCALESVRGQTPEFFTGGSLQVEHCSRQPDRFRALSKEPFKRVEMAEHYFDVEFLKGKPFPDSRAGFLALCAADGLDPYAVGFLPYAVVEWHQRLAVAFAEHRLQPDSLEAKSACLVYAGLLAHYAGDLCQPLHLTVEFDGRLKPDGTSPRTGIHSKVDALPGKAGLDVAAVGRQLKAEVWPDTVTAVRRAVDEGRALIDRVYEMEKDLPLDNEPLGDHPAVKAFAGERLATAGRFLASLYLTAWTSSGAMEFPPPRGKQDGVGAPGSAGSVSLPASD